MYPGYKHTRSLRAYVRMYASAHVSIQIAQQIKIHSQQLIPIGIVDTVLGQWLRSIQANRILHLHGLNAVIPSPLIKARDLFRALETDGVAHEVGLVVQLCSTDQQTVRGSFHGMRFAEPKPNTRSHTVMWPFMQYLDVYTVRKFDGRARLGLYATIKEATSHPRRLSPRARFHNVDGPAQGA